MDSYLYILKAITRAEADRLSVYIEFRNSHYLLCKISAISAYMELHIIIRFD
jgi:hypothetical protein